MYPILQALHVLFTCAWYPNIKLSSSFFVQAALISGASVTEMMESSTVIGWES